jgi:hypothetical protein
MSNFGNVLFVHEYTGAAFEHPAAPAKGKPLKSGLVEI